MSDTLASIKDRILDMKERNAVDWTLIMDALEVLTDAAIAAQPHGPPLPPELQHGTPAPATTPPGRVQAEDTPHE